MTTTQERTAPALSTSGVPHIDYVNDYGAELANAQVGEESLNAAGRAHSISLGTTNRKFDSVAQAHHVRDRVRELLDDPNVHDHYPNGNILVASTDQRSENGDERREANEGAPLYAAYIPEIDLLIVMANADDCWALLAEELAELNVTIHKVPFDHGTQFRGAYVFPEKAQEVWDAIHDPENFDAVCETRSLTPIEENGITNYRPLDADELGPIYARITEIENAEHGGVSVYYSSGTVIDDEAIVALLVADYVHNPVQFEAAQQSLSPVTIPADINPNDALNAGFQFTLLALNAHEPILAVVDFADPDLSEGVAVFAAQLPGGGLAVAPSNYGIWEHLAKAGLEIYLTDIDVTDIPNGAAKLWRGELELDPEELGPIGGFDEPPTDVVLHVDTFGQTKIILSKETAELLTRAAKLATALERTVTVPIQIDDLAPDAAHVGKGIFDVQSGGLVIAPGSSFWIEQDGTEVRAFEFAVRDDSAADRFTLEPETTTGRARSGARVSIDVDRLREIVDGLEADFARTTGRVAALELPGSELTFAADRAVSGGIA